VQRLQARIEELEAALRDVKRTHPIGYLVGRAVYHSRRWLSRGVWAHSKLPGSGAAHRLNSNKQSQSLTDVL